MTMISISITAVCCLIVAAVIGYFRSPCRRWNAVARSNAPGRASAENDNATVWKTSQISMKAEDQLRLLVESLYELTSQVDSQVGEHSNRVSEITNSLESPDEVGSSMVLAAGKLLVSANQKLQADLDEAKSEIQRQRRTDDNACDA